MSPRILDAGCGTGRYLPKIIQKFDPKSFVGIDCSQRMLDMARRRFGTSALNWVQGDLQKIPFPDNSFDAIIGIWVVETMSKPALAVKEFLRVLRPGGVVGYTFVHIPPELDLVESRLRTALIADERHGVRSCVTPMPFHNCEHSRLSRFRDNFITVATLSKCCSVEGQLMAKSANLKHAHQILFNT